MPWKHERDLDTAFLAQSDRLPNDIFRPSVARQNLEAIGIDTSTPQTLFDAMEVRRLSFMVQGPDVMHAWISFYESPMNETLSLARGSAYTVIGAIYCALWMALKAYPEYRSIRTGLRRDTDPFA